MSKYLHKHEVVPNYIPHATCDVNLSVVFNGKYQTRARNKDAMDSDNIDSKDDSKLQSKNSDSTNTQEG